MGALVQQSINDSKISGGDRPVAWDGETRSGAGLQNQLKQIQDSKVGPSFRWSSRGYQHKFFHCRRGHSSVVVDVSLKACGM